MAEFQVPVVKKQVLPIGRRCPLGVITVAPDGVRMQFATAGHAGTIGLSLVDHPVFFERRHMELMESGGHSCVGLSSWPFTD